MPDHVELKMPVWHPDRPLEYVDTIDSNEAHVGNKVAEWGFPKEMYWPEVARIYREQLRAVHREITRDRDDEIRRDYASNWVSIGPAEHKQIIVDRKDR